MEEMSTFPCLPPNFVSLQKLQEQRLKEQEQKKKQEEAEELRKLKEEEIKTIPNGSHRKNRQKKKWVEGEVVIRTIPNALPRKDRRKKKWESSKYPEPKKLEESEIKNLQEEGELQMDLEKSKMTKAERRKEWHKMKTVRKRSKLKEPIATASDRSTEEKLSSPNPTVEMVVDVDEVKEEAELDAKGVELNGKRLKDVNQRWRIKPPNGKMLNNPTAEIVQRIGAISVIGDDEKMSSRSTAEMNGGLRGGRFGYRGRRVGGGRGGDGNLIWVKKDEVTQSNGHGYLCGR